MSTLPPLPLPFIHYVLELQSSGLTTRLELNGIELLTYAPTDKAITQQKINGWLVSGDNHIVLSTALPAPEHAVDPVNLKVLLFRSSLGKQPDEESALARFAERDKTKLPTGKLQVVWQTSFRSDPIYGPWIWEAAPPFAPGPATTAGVLTALRTVLEALRAHDTAKVLQLFSVYLNETARAYHYKLERLTGQLQEWAAAWSGLNPHLSPDLFTIVVEGNGRLARVERKDHLPLFTMDPKKPDEGPDVLYLTYSVTEGWIIVR